MKLEEMEKLYERAFYEKDNPYVETIDAIIFAHQKGKKEEDALLFAIYVQGFLDGIKRQLEAGGPI